MDFACLILKKPIIKLRVQNRHLQTIQKQMLQKKFLMHLEIKASWRVRIFQNPIGIPKIIGGVIFHQKTETFLTIQKKYPQRWEDFKTFTYNQIQELMTGYGTMDILWLDGGWVRPKSSIDTTVEWQRTITHNQDIDMPKIAAMARTHQPGLLVVDRTVHGEYENYVTPEQQVPATYLPYPWESCITLGNSWSYVPGDQYKSSRKVIHMLTDIISKNGNLLLNVGPGPDGEWDSLAYNRLEAIGKWMKINGEAVYDTEADPNLPRQGKWAFTRKGTNIYAIYQVADNEMVENSLSVTLPAGIQVKAVSVIGGPQKVKFTQTGGQVVLFTADKSIVKQTEAFVFKLVTS